MNTEEIKHLESILVNPGHIKPDDWEKVKNISEINKQDIGEVLVEENLIKDEELGRLIAEDRDFDFVDLRQEKIDENLTKLIPEIVAKKQGVIAFAEDGDSVKVGMVNPADTDIIHILEKRFGKNVKPYMITRQDHRKAMGSYKKSLKEEIENVIKELKQADPANSSDNKSVVRIVDLLIEHAVYNHASDIHIEPEKNEVVVRYRIDSVMHRVVNLPKNQLESILMRIKILSKMRTDEHMAAQDGKFQYKADLEKVDIRVSIVPVTDGENVVMRLLSTKVRQLNLKNIGLNKNNLKIVERVIKNPQGMILTTGPTGSGKTTTLYAVLQIINRPEVHVSTIEDPVEYDIPGVSQIQVNTKTNLSFAQGLRAIVRQDPDIIMVGEIRDRDTAEIAVNSAMTGHLVLSTIHASDAATTLPRLIDMGIEPYLIASTVNVVIAQRLVRKLCLKCRVSYELDNDEIEIINGDPNLKAIFLAYHKKDASKIRMYKSEGCKVCADTGYSGRLGVFEVMEINEKIKELIVNRAPSHELVKAARANGMTTMVEDGLGKAFTGETTLHEVLRVTRS